MSDNAEPACLHLRQPCLAGLRLPSLQTLTLHLWSSHAAALDLSWLGQPRAFRLSLELDKHGAAGPGQRQALLGSLPSLLHPTDSLSLRLLGSGVSLCEAEWEALAHLQLQTSTLHLPRPCEIRYLPQASELEVVIFGWGSGMCWMDWSAVTHCPGLVVVRAMYHVSPRGVSATLLEQCTCFCFCLDPACRSTLCGRPASCQLQLCTLAI